MKYDRLLCKIEDSIVVVAGMLILLLTIVGCIDRYCIGLPMPWYEEVLRILYMFVVFWGCSILARKSEHLRVTILGDVLKGKAKEFHELLVTVASLLVSLLCAYFAMKLAFMESGRTVYLGIPNKAVIFSCMGLGFVAMTVRYLQEVWVLVAAFRRRGREEQ